MITQLLHHLGNLRIVSGHGTCFATGSEVLSRIEAEGRGFAHRARLSPTLLLLRKVFGPVSLAGVFHHDQVVLLGQLEDRVHVRHLSVQMNGHHRCDRAPFASSASGPKGIEFALGLQVRAQLRPDRGCRSSRRCPQTPVIAPACEIASVVAMKVLGTVMTLSPSLDAARHQRKAQRVRAAAHADAVLRLAECRKVALEATQGSTDKASRIQRSFQDIEAALPSVPCAELPDQEMESSVSSFRHPDFIFDMPQKTRRIARDDRVGGNIFCHHAACTHDCILANVPHWKEWSLRSRSKRLSESPFFQLSNPPRSAVRRRPWLPAGRCR